MDFTSVATSMPRSSILEQGTPKVDLIRAVIPDGSPLAVEIDEAIVLAESMPTLPPGPESRQVARDVARAQVEAALSGAKFDIVKASKDAVAAADAATLAAFASRLAATEVRQLLYGTVIRAIPGLFAAMCEEVADLQDELVRLDREHGVVVHDELAARRANLLEIWMDAEFIRQRFDVLQAAWSECRRLTDRDQRSRHDVAARFKGVVSGDVSRAIEAAFEAAPHVLVAAAGQSWTCWFPSEAMQAQATEQRYARSA